jgi:hypothetical protein
MVCVPEPMDILRCGPAEWSEILRRGARAWNAWRDEYPWIIPDLTGIAPSVIECQLGPLTGGPVNLANARLRGARLGRATLSEANLEGADLSERLDRANLSYANSAQIRNISLIVVFPDISAITLRLCCVHQDQLARVNFVVGSSGEQVAVEIQRQGDLGVPQPLLDGLRWQLTAAIDPPVFS